MVLSISLTGDGWNMWVSLYQRCSAGAGPPQFIAKMSKTSLRDGVRQLSQANPSRLNLACGELTVSIAGSYIAKWRCKMRWGQSLNGMGRVTKSKIESVRKTAYDVVKHIWPKDRN